MCGCPIGGGQRHPEGDSEQADGAVHRGVAAPLLAGAGAGGQDVGLRGGGARRGQRGGPQEQGPRQD
eukprot:9127154-Pyramimonas_sp.AAC.1